MKPTDLPPGDAPVPAVAGAVGAPWSDEPAPVAVDGSVGDSGDAEGTTVPVTGRAGRSGNAISRLLPAPVWRVGKLLLVALVVEYFVLPRSPVRARRGTS